MGWFNHQLVQGMHEKKDMNPCLEIVITCRIHMLGKFTYIYHRGNQV